MMSAEGGDDRIALFVHLHERREALPLGRALALDTLESAEDSRRTRVFAVDALEGAASSPSPPDGHGAELFIRDPMPVCRV